jgi:hypothetical protein
MKRRQYVRGVLCAAAVTVAGCSGDDGPTPTATDVPATDTDTQVDTPTATDTPTETPTETPEPIETARTQLGLAANELDREGDAFSRPGDGVDFEAETVTGHLDGADAALEIAGRNATGDRAETVDALRETSAWLRATATALEEFAGMMSVVQEGIDHFEGNRFEEAITALQDAQDARESASEQVDVAEERLNGIDVERVEGIDEIDFPELQESFETLDRTVAAMEFFLAGYIDLTRGFREFLPAATDYDEGGYADAIDGFETARGHFENARPTFEEGETVAPPEFESSMADLTCLAGAMRDGADHYAAAAEAADAGNDEEASQRVADAEAALDRCEE